MVFARYLNKCILDDLKRKIIILSGPRQAGKTTLTKMLSRQYDYINFDNAEHRLIINERSWDRKKELIIFDELHKLKNWKSWLKGIYDTEGNNPAIIVTGSAKIDTYKKVGDSLAGRYFYFRLHPLDLKEINKNLKPADTEKELEKLLETGGFPEPCLEGKINFYNRWKQTHMDIIIRQDLIELEKINELVAMETLIQLLRSRVGSPVSYASLARDLQCSDKSVKKWLTILENMYVIFKVTPYNKNIARSLLKAPKYYFYDTGYVKGEDGIKLENTVACALLKEIHFQNDCLGNLYSLYYLKDKEGREVDFLILKDDSFHKMIEVKWSEKNLTKNFAIFEKNQKAKSKIQLVKELKKEKTFPDNSELRMAHKWLSDFSF